MQKMASKKRLICRRGAFTWGACGLSDRKCNTDSLALCAALTLSPAAMAFADIGGEPANPGGSGDIYVPDNYQDPGTMPLERGQCTDVYSKAWCDSHGYKNNRPVPKAVPLNAKERECYWGLMRSGSKAALCAMVGNVGGVLTAAPGVAFTLYKCFK